VRLSKRLSLVFDPVRSGAALKFIQEEECPAELQGLFAGRKVIDWHRIKDFQLVSLKLLATDLLFACPGYEMLYCRRVSNDEELSLKGEKTLLADIHVPGEITEKHLTFPAMVRVYASPNNPGAQEVAKVLQGAIAGIELSAAPPPVATHFLLYLSEETFVGEAGERLANEVRFMMRGGLPIVMLHENDAESGGCEFATFFATTPQDLIANGLYKALALAYMPGHFRPVSLALIAKKLGAVPQRGIRSWGTSLSRLWKPSARRLGEPVTTSPLWAGTSDGPVAAAAQPAAATGEIVVGPSAVLGASAVAACGDGATGSSSELFSVVRRPTGSAAPPCRSYVPSSSCTVDR